MEYGEEASHDPTDEEKVGIMGDAISLQIVSNTNTNSNPNTNTNIKQMFVAMLPTLMLPN